jgi:hypothetical protein
LAQRQPSSSTAGLGQVRRRSLWQPPCCHGCARISSSAAFCCSSARRQALQGTSFWFRKRKKLGPCTCWGGNRTTAIVVNGGRACAEGCHAGSEMPADAVAQLQALPPSRRHHHYRREGRSHRYGRRCRQRPQRMALARAAAMPCRARPSSRRPPASGQLLSLIIAGKMRQQQLLTTAWRLRRTSGCSGCGVTGVIPGSVTACHVCRASASLPRQTRRCVSVPRAALGNNRRPPCTHPQPSCSR